MSYQMVLESPECSGVRSADRRSDSDSSGIRALAEHGSAAIRGGALEHTIAALVQKAVTKTVDKLAESLVNVVRTEIHKALTEADRTDLVDGDGWVSPKQAARLASVSYDTVLAWISEEKLRASKVGRQFRIRREDLEIFMSQPPRAERVCSHDIDSEAARILGGRD